MKKEETVAELILRVQKEIKEMDDAKARREAEARILDIARQYDGEDKVVSSLDIAERLKNAPPEDFIPSGYLGLDSILKGFLKGQLVVISAATKSGKTSFCIELTSHMKDRNPLWLPFEEGAPELIQKFLDRGESPPLFFTPDRMTGNTIAWVEKKVIESKAKYNTKVIFIDHLHFIVDFGENMSVQIGRTMRELKRIARTLDVCIFLIAHLKKTKMDTQPDLEDLRDSSFIAQEADTVIMLWRQMKKEKGEVIITNNVNVSVQANRRTGKTGNVKFVFEDGKFKEEMWYASEAEQSYAEKW
jgi:replicative DNA helicase